MVRIYYWVNEIKNEMKWSKATFRFKKLESTDQVFLSSVIGQKTAIKVVYRQHSAGKTWDGFTVCIMHHITIINIVIF